jgi:hypothetical protein
MSYLTQNEIANNTSMINRVAMAATVEGKGPDADGWTYQNRRLWASAPGWDAAWESARVSHGDDGDPETPAYDPGADETVITDGMILDQIQAMP